MVATVQCAPVWVVRARAVPCVTCGPPCSRPCSLRWLLRVVLCLARAWLQEEGFRRVIAEINQLFTAITDTME